MTSSDALEVAMRDAWASIPAPPIEDLKYMEWGFGERQPAHSWVSHPWTSTLIAPDSLVPRRCLNFHIEHVQRIWDPTC